MDGAKRFSCKCGVAFTSERSLNFHRGSRACRLRDPAAVRFSCSECKFTAYYQITLDKHMQIRHSNQTPFECKCGTSFGQLEALLRHQESALTCKKYHTCKLCGHISPTQGQLNRHLRSHSEEKPFVCGCGRAYPRKDSYYRHKRSCRKLGNEEESIPAAAPAAAPVSASAIPAVAAAPAVKPPVSAQISAPVQPVQVAAITPSASSSVSAPQAQPLTSSAPAPTQPVSLPPMGFKPNKSEALPSPRELAFMRPPNTYYLPQQPTSAPPVQVHAPMFVPHYMSQYVRMNAPQDASTIDPPPPSQLMNLSYLASMKAPLNAPVPSDMDVPALGRE